MKRIPIILSCIISVGCVTVSNLKPAQVDLTTMQQKVPGISFEDVQQGFRMYKFNCSGCHYLPKPTDYTINGWQKILPGMLERAKITSDKDREQITNYLYAKSK